MSAGLLLLVAAAASSRGQAAATGSLHGSVRWVGQALPAARQIVNTTDPAVCGAHHSTGVTLVDERGGIAGVIVRLADAPAQRSPPPRTLVLDNVDCEFQPKVAVLTAGSTVVARNRDPTLHTVHFYGPQERNLALPLIDVEIPVRLDRAGRYAIKCDVHGWMEAYLQVDPHPWHDTSDASGAFRIEEVPPGRYTLELWHDRLGAHTRSVEILPGRTTRLDVELGADPAAVPPPPR